MIRYRLELTVGYRFARPLGGAARQLLRIRPAVIDGVQAVDRCVLSCRPEPAERSERRDFFGTAVLELVVPAGAEQLSVGLEAEVRRARSEPEADLSGPLAGLAAELAQVTHLGADSPHHFLWPSPRIPALPGIAAFAAEAAAGAATVRAAVEAVGLAVHEAMHFDPAATTVETPVAEAFAQRAGVCQDLAQVMIAGLRGLGVPAAYVSGYLRTDPPPGRPRLRGADAMHAWVRAWTGRAGGWVDYDPTNAAFAGADHVVIGHGRDYGDAAPVVGTLRLEGGHAGFHAVDLEPI